MLLKELIKEKYVLRLIESNDPYLGEESGYMWKIEGGKGKGKLFGDKNTSVDDHLSAMDHHRTEYENAMGKKKDSDAQHHKTKYNKHKDQIAFLQYHHLGADASTRTNVGRRTHEAVESKIDEESGYMWKIEGGKGKGKLFGDKNTSVDDHLSAMDHHSKEYRKAMDGKRDSDARHHGMKYHKHKDQIERLGSVGNYMKDDVEVEISGDEVELEEAVKSDNPDRGYHGQHNEEVEISEATKPGWMLDADPELKAKVKKNTDKAKRMNTLMKKYGGRTGPEIEKMKEEIEQIDEIGDTPQGRKKLAKYIRSAADDVAAKGAATRQFSNDARVAKSQDDYRGAREKDEKAKKVFDKSWKRREMIGKAANRLAREEVEQIGEAAYGWGTTKTEDGYDWHVRKVGYNKPTEILHTGSAPTRAKAVRQAKKHVMPYRRLKEESSIVDKIIEAKNKAYKNKTKTTATGSKANEIKMYPVIDALKGRKV